MQLPLFPDDQCNTPVTPSLADRVKLLMEQMLDRRHHIEAALEYTAGTHTFDDLVQMVLSGRLFWMVLPNSFAITEIIEYPRAKHLHVFLAGGDLNEVRSIQSTLVDAARLAGCSALTLSGRRGWVKALQDLGWKESCATVSFTVTADNEASHGEKRRVADHGS